MENELKPIYEKPELTKVGDAQDVILGFATAGDDLDMNWVFSQLEFEPESIPEE